MKGKISLLTRKVFATVIAIAMSIPPTAFANNDSPQIYNMDSSVMGVREDNEEKLAEVNNTDETKLEKDLGDYTLEISSTLDESLEKIDYTIIARRKENLEDNSDKNLSLTITNIPVSNINKLSLVSASTDTQENELNEASLQGLHLTSKASDEIIYKLTADVKKAKNDRAYKLVLGLIDENEKTSVLSYDLKVKTTKEVIDQEEAEVIALELDDEEKSSAIGEYKKEGILGGIFASHDSITWTDYIVNEENENKEFTYDFTLDENQNTENSQINLDYYELTENGFEIKKEFSQAIDFAEKINFEIPQGFVAKITLKTEVDKKNTAIKNYSLNNRVVKNPIYIEGSEEENKDGEEDPLPTEEKENTEKTSSDNTVKEETKEENHSKDKSEESTPDKKGEPSIDKEEKTSDSEIKVTDSTGKEIEEKDTISALILNKDSLISKLEKDDKLTEELKSFIEELTINLTSYNEEKITDQELKDFTKALVENNQIEEADLRLYLESILSGLNKQKNKAANLNLDEIIDYAYPEEKASEKTEETEDLTNLEKADKELKEALADENNGIEEIQALLDSFEEKYNLDRDAQEKLMTDNNDAINALVEKDREENHRPNNLRAKEAFLDKKFRLTTTMQIKASSALPMPKGWYFDVDLGPYLREDYENPLKPLEDGDGKVIATPSYNPQTHTIRYTIEDRLISNVDLKIDQLLAFDINEIGDTDPIKINISVKPRGMAAQQMGEISVSSDDTRKEILSIPGFNPNIESPENESSKVEYPVILEYHSHQTLRDANGNEAKLGQGINPQGLEVWWDIQVETDKLFPADKNLEFRKLYFTLFAPDKQGLEKGTYKIANTETELNGSGYTPMGKVNNLYQAIKAINKSDLPKDKIYIRVKMPLKDGEYHSNYSLGLRVNPDKNYMQAIVDKAISDYKKIPSIFKFIKGLEDAKTLAETPFNLVEDMFVAEFVHLGDPTVDENFYYDRTRTIAAQQEAEYSKRRWFAMDLLRVGETEDYGLAYANLIPNPLKNNKYYYIPKKDGGYRRTTNVNDATLPNGSYKPGVIVYYDYDIQVGTKDTNFKLDVNLKQKPIDNSDVINNYEDIVTEGGRQNLYSRKLAQKEIGYLAYLEVPYYIMRINNTFEMVQCLNARKPDPTVNGRGKIYLDRVENPTGAILYSNISTTTDNVKNYTKDYLEPGGKYNQNGLSREAATEDLFKRIYFFAEEIKREYPKNHNKTEMHRMIENQMLQRVIHYFTDAKALTVDYAYSGVPTKDTVSIHNDITLTGTNPQRPEDNFKGDGGANADGNGYRKLSENESLDLEGLGLKGAQVKYASELLKRIEDSYNNDDWENQKKANTVTLVYFEHGKAEYQNLLSGRVVDPITAYKVDSDGKKLEGAEFTFVNIYTGEIVKATATKDGMKVYLAEGTYRVRETKAPEGYEIIEPFTIKVTNNEVNPDEGDYPLISLRIKVNDGYETKEELTSVPKDIDGNPLVRKGKGKLEIEVVNISNKFGKLQFTKRDASKKLDGSQFTLTKIKSQRDKTPELLNGQPVYKKTSKGDFGEFEFSKMPVGFYLLEETVVPKGYEKAKDQIIEVSLDQSGKAVTRFLDKDIEASKVILNEAKTTELKLRKIDSELDNKGKQVLLQNAKFRIYSERTIDNILYFEERTSGIDGIVSFEGLKEGEYILEELTAPSGYLLPKFLEEPDKFFGWKLFVKLGDNGELKYDIYKLKYREDAKKTEEQLKDSKVDLNTVLKDGAVNVKNKIRTVNWEFKKYIENPNFDPSKEVDEKTNPKYIPLTDATKLKNISFNLYEADYYGRIIDENNPIKRNIKADPNGVFHLEGLKFNGYYKLREVTAPGGLIKASDITLKIEAETIANEGTMKVIVRDPSNDVIIGEHAIFKGVINFNEGAKLGKLAIKKTGKSLWPQDNGKEVGLRRAFFRLYTADDNFDIVRNKGGYPAEYIQKVTDGVALTDEKGNPTDPSTFPESQGIAVFDNIKPGKYVLEEYRGPAGYEKDPRPIYVLVDEKGNVFKSWDKNDPILHPTTANRVRAAQTFDDVTTPLRAGETNNNEALTKEYDGTYAKITVKANAIDTAKGTRQMSVTVTSKGRTLDFSLGYNSYITAKNFKPSEYDGLYNAATQRKYYKYNIQPNKSFTLEFDTELNDGSEDVYKNILNQLQVYDKTSRRYEYFTNAFEDFKIMKKSNNFKVKVQFEHHYYDYEGKGKIPPEVIGTGKIWLETLENRKWVKVPGTEKQAYKESQLQTEFPEFTGLDKSKTYRIAYKLDKTYAFKELWNWPSDTSYYNIDQSQADKDGNVLVKITNGNLVKIFNKDETGFRIPLRIEKANEDKSPLSGAKFRAKKIVDGEKVKGKDEYPKYYDEPFDAVTEATGLAGENYFRELTPGIYEMWEEEAPNEYTKLKNKWYFKVEVDPEKQPNQANYMRIVFDFSYKFPIDLSDKKYSHLTEAEKNRLRGKTIFGLNSNEKTTFEDDRLTQDAYKEFIRNVQILEDNKISKPARPDAPYKGIDVVGVTNHKSLGQLEFKKVAFNNNPVEGATFRLTKVRVESNGKLIIKSTDKKPDPVIDDKGNIVYQKQITSKGILGIKFDGITEGTYILEEIEAPEGYKKPDSFIVIKYKEDSDGKLVQTVDKTQSDPDFLKLLTFKNGAEIESIKNEDNLTKLTFQKVNSKGLVVGTSVFNLQAVDKDGNVKMVNGEPEYDKTLGRYGDDTKYEFTGLKEGRYKLTEINYTIYAKPEPWYFNVVKDKDGNLAVKFENENDNTIIKNDDGTYNVVNYAKTNFRFTKVGQGLDSPPIPLSNIYFSLKRVKTDETENGIKISYDENGNVTSMTDKDGKELIKRNDEGIIQNPEILGYGYYNRDRTRGDGGINFDNLGPGVYELEEITKHASFNTNTQRKWIIVVKKGSKELEVSYDKKYEAEYYKKYDKKYFDEIYVLRNFKDSNLLTGNENEGFNVLNIRDKIDIRWRKVDSETGGVIFDGVLDQWGKPVNKNAEFSMFTLHKGLISEDSKEFEEAWHKTGQQSRPLDIYTVDGTYGVFGLEPGVYALPEMNPPTGYKRDGNRNVIVLVTEKGKLKTTDPNYVENSNELVYKLFEQVGTAGNLSLVSDPKDFKIIKINGKGEIEFNKDGFFDIKNKPKEDKGHFVIEKKDNKNRPLEGAVFELIDFQGNVIRRAKADENGKVIFAGITQEVYTLREAEPPIGYKKSDKVWKVFVKGNGHTFIREGTSEDNPPEDITDYKTPTLTVTNTPVNPTGEFTVSKVDNEDKPLQGATFKLEKTEDADGKLLTPTITIDEKTSDDKGKILFEKLEPGTYELTETKAPDDYKKVSDKWEITVDKEGKTTVVKSTGNAALRTVKKFLNKINPVDLLRAEDAEVPIEDIKVPNDKLVTGNFQIKKTDTDKTTVLQGAEFTLVRVKDEAEQPVTGEDKVVEVSGKDGIAKFEKLKPGEYKLTETKSPIGYEVLKEEYIVKVIDKGGKVTVKITKPDKTDESITSTETNSQESTIIFSSQDGWDYTEGKVIYKVSKTNILGEYNLDVEYTPTTINYNASRVLNLIFDTDNFDVLYNGRKIAANQANITLYTHQNYGLQKVTFLLKAKDITKAQELNPIKQFSWAGQVGYNLQNNPEAYPKIELKKETTTVAGEEIELSGDTLEYTLVNNKKKFDTEFSKVGRVVEGGTSKDTPLANAVFSLEKKVADDKFEKLDRSFISDNEGKLVLNDLEAGEYKLYETNSPSGYRPIKGEAKEFKIDDNGNTFVKKNGEYVPLGDSNKVIVNEKYGTESYEFVKRDGVTKEPLSGVEFELLNSDGELIATQTSGDDGKVSFDGLQPGKYWIREKSQKEGYIIPKKPLKVIIGEKWKAPVGIEGKNVSSYFSLNPLKPSTLTSTTDSETVVYPNVQEGLFAKLNFSINNKVKPGDYFVMTFSKNVDLDGLSTIDDSEFDIYGPMGRIAIAKVRKDRHVIDYTFTEAVDYYNDLRELTINTQMFVNRKLVQYNTDNLEVSIKIQDPNGEVGNGVEFKDTINVNYDNDTNNGYINALENVKTYQLRLGTSSEKSRYFTNVIYVNPVRSKDGEKDLYFSANLPYTIDNVKIYKKTKVDNKDLPWSFDIDHKKDNEYGLVDITNTVNWNFVQGDSKKIHIDLGHGAGSYNTDEYVIEISGVVNDTGEFKTTTEYNRRSPYFLHQWHNVTPNYDVIDYWKTWTKEYNPEVQGELAHDLYNYKNKIEFTKLEARTEKPLSGVLFELRKLGEDNKYTKVDGKDKTSNAEGKLVWEGLPEGKYQVWETKPLAGYKDPGEEVASFEVNTDGSITNTSGNTTIVNEKEGMKFYLDKIYKDDKATATSIKKGTLEVELQAIEGGTFPDNVKVEDQIPQGRGYRIKEISNDRKSITLEIDLSKAYEDVTTKDGKIKQAIRIEVPADWPQGRYSLVETKAPAGYIKTDKEFSLIINHENGEIRHEEKVLYHKGETNDAISILEIENKRGIFPSTGGPGVWIGFTVIGLAVMIGGAFIYNKRQTRLTEWWQKSTRGLGEKVGSNPHRTLKQNMS